MHILRHFICHIILHHFGENYNLFLKKCIVMGSIPALYINKKHPERGAFVGAADRNRTGTDFTPRDFKSLVSTYSTTAAYLFV